MYRDNMNVKPEMYMVSTWETDLHIENASLNFASKISEK